MAIIEMHHFSTALQRHIGLTVIVPEGPGPHPAVYQLHGLSDDHTVWSRRTSIERYAERHGLLIAMPEGGRSFYCNAPGAVERAEDHILETIAVVDRTFKTIPERSARAIGGLSMGGYGAMKIALKHPHLFASVVSHSGCPDCRVRFKKDGYQDLIHAFGDSMPTSEDALALATRLKRSRGPRPAILFDCGTEDFLLDQNRVFRDHLQRIGLAHEYREFPGGHSWEYWDEHVQEALLFHVAAFAAAKRDRNQRPARSTKSAAKKSEMKSAKKSAKARAP